MKFIDSKNVSHNGTDLPSALFDIVLHDEFYSIFRYCLRETKSVSDVVKELNITEDFLTNFIDVASYAHKNEEKLFEAKYHMFIRSIEGVYITLKPSEKLFIHKTKKYISPDDNFEY